MFYRKKTVATSYESDANNLLRLSGMLRHMQQTSGEQLSSIGQSNEWLAGHDMAFLLTKSNTKVHRNPVCGEKIVIGTAATPPKGVKFVREFIIETPQGERLVSSYSLWVLVDIKNHKILRPSMYPHTWEWENPTLEEAPGDIAIPKQTLPGAQSWAMQRTAHYSYIDVNKHVNNSVYADFICDALPYDLLTSRGISTMAINFQKEAKHGDTLTIQTFELEESAYKIVGVNGEAPCFEAYVRLR